MSNFYARYMPPTKKVNSTSEAAALSGSTKRKLPEQDLAVREPKKPRTASLAELKNDGFGVKRFVPKEKKPRTSQEAKLIAETIPSQPEVGQVSSTGQNVLDKYRVIDAAKKSGSPADVQLRRPLNKNASETKKHDPAEPVKKAKPKKIKQKRIEQLDVEGEVSGTLHVRENSAEDDLDKHTAVRDRFKKARKKSEQHQDQVEPEPDTQGVGKPELHGLEPLPQPLDVEQPYEPPSYSTLPPWLAKADRISENATSTFASLGLSESTLENLKKNGLGNAMPIQSAVIPLLSKGAVRHDGDLAVAAATGSGKTLAYVLPMVEALKELAITKLRGIIVVPTRELVKQVQDTFSVCAEGTNLRAATALGSKSIKEEADALIESYEVYDPETYAEQQSRKVDWAELSLMDLFDRAKEGARHVPDHVVKHRSKVDVLICTPGRLVEHLRTKGFSLDDVQWLVIDEVDRLLNESYQEWLEVVMPALQSRRAAEARDKVLQDMGLDLPPRLITKVILSATMTKDLSKLNSLNLRNPRLLVLEGDKPTETQNAKDETVEPSQDATGAFQLPSTLTETAVLVSDGSDKPLHLLELLRTRIRIASTNKPFTNGTIMSDSDSETSSSDSSNDNSSSDSDSESGSSGSSITAQTNGVKPSPQPSSKYKYPSTLIFTRSTSAAPRLSRLLSLLDPSLDSTTAVLTRSTASSASSRRALKAFRAGTISILITTDRASRGLDIPNIKHVINYDVPGSVEFYVHRVGRTARAGKMGHAWSLVEHRQGRWFDGEIAKGSLVRRNGKVSKLTLEGVGKDEEMGKRYGEALKRLGEEVEGK